VPIATYAATHPLAHHIDVTLLRRHVQRREAVRIGLVHIDVLVREQEPHHLDVTLP
jgi:hypothetical protein